jgi:HAD superfamily hydrolase (TIGR01509 family)
MSIRFETVFFDFGGCIDAPGIHSRTLFWEAFLRAGLLPDGERSAFQEAYTQADHQMMASGEARGMALREFNRHNGALIGKSMGLKPTEGASASDWVTSEMDRYLRESVPVLSELAKRAPLAIISNFTGNLNVILEEYELKQFFGSVSESFYVGSAKPSPKIFRAALAAQGKPAEVCLYVGDNPKNDIEPALALGFRTALIHQVGFKKDCGADFYLENFSDLLTIVK